MGYSEETGQSVPLPPHLALFPHSLTVLANKLGTRTKAHSWVL